MSELMRRVVVALLGIPLAIVAVYWGDAVLATLLAVIAALGAWEFCRIARAGGSEPFDGLAIVMAAGVPLIVHGVYRHVVQPTVTHFVIVALAVLAATIFFRGPDRKPLAAAATTVFGVGYVSMIAYVYTIRYHDYVIDARGGTTLVMLPIVLTWANDIGAYAIGRMVGERKLLPSVSPGKTVAGSIGGVICSVIVCGGYVRYLLHPFAQLTFTPGRGVLFAVIVAAVAQIGDLAESLLKREAGMKDSSQLIPGHGGVLDRFDSLLFVLPVSALLLSMLLIPALV